MTGEESMAGELDRFRLDGRVVVVTGGYGGIGERLARAFVDVGGKVASSCLARPARAGARSGSQHHQPRAADRARSGDAGGAGAGDDPAVAVLGQ